MTTLPEPPEHLSDKAKSWWLDVVARYRFDGYELELLTLAAEALDRCIQAREIIAEKGLSYEDKRGLLRMRPECVIEKDSRMAFAKIVKQLDLNTSELSGQIPGNVSHKKKHIT